MRGCGQFKASRRLVPATQVPPSLLPEIMGTLYFRRMKHDPANPGWSERDYFINSKAHSAPGFYSALAVAGYFQPEELKTLRQLGSRLQGHPVRHSEHQKHHSVPGIEYSGGSEGIGLSVGIGIALAKKLDGMKNRVFVLIGDGESNEGQIWEASMAVGKFRARQPSHHFGSQPHPAGRLYGRHYATRPHEGQVGCI